jgi:hypothetical protein
MKATIAIAGGLAQRPYQGGHTWVFLQYLLGFRRLGYDVLFLDYLEPAMCSDGAGRPSSTADSINLLYVSEVMSRFGLGERWAVIDGQSNSTFGLPRKEVARRMRSALLINVMGYLRDENFLHAAHRRVFLDIDPGVPQMWHELGQADLFTGHDAFVTIGENIGRDHCPIPTCARSWHRLPPPIFLEEWPPVAGGDGAFTSIATWRGPYGPINYQGQSYGSRVHEFRTYLSLPLHTGCRFRLALDIHKDETRDRDALHSSGWQIEDPLEAAGDPWRYRQYIRRSAAELMIAKHLYVKSRSGWFSDRSVAYLASGKPVLAQDTGFSYGGEVGLVKFRSMTEAVAGVESIQSDWARHCAAARDIACTHFDSDVVLGRWINLLGL